MFWIITDTVLRTLFAYVLVLTVARVAGRKLISSMTFFDFVIGVTVGSVTANLAMGAEKTPLSATIVLLVLGVFVVLTGLGHIKSITFRKIVDSEPVIAIEKGRIVEANLKKVRCTLDGLLMQLREKNIFNVADVEFAVLETDGQLSVLPKAEKQPMTPSDLHLPAAYEGLTRDIVYDGQLLEENLYGTGLDRESVLQLLKKQNIGDVKDVFYAGLSSKGILYVSPKTAAPEKEGQHGIE